ncbi:Zn-ribbon domain-containing OB-fold protein [Syntrophomonas erecta]
MVEINGLSQNGERELKIQYCPDCSHYIFFPRRYCPYCLQARPRWVTSRGKGKVYSYTIVRKSALEEFVNQVPYVYAIIELEEGVRLISNLVNCSLDEIKIGMPVKITWRDETEELVPVFQPDKGV